MITGGDGYLGLGLARRLLERGQAVLLWMRAADEDEARSKRERVTRALGAAAGAAQLVFAELEDEQPFRAVQAREVRAIVHAAAITRFNVERERARAVNVDGTVKALRFAARCDALESFDYVSSLYATGLGTGTIEEGPAEGEPGFANHYEWSKREAERELLEGFDQLPWRVLRVATVIADDDSGRVTQYNAVHSTLKLVFYGLLSLIAGDESVRPYFVTGELATRAVCDILEGGATRRFYHLCHAPEHNPCLGEVVDLALEIFGRDEGFRARRILRPLFCDAESFELLARSIDGFGGPVVRQALESVAPFARQLFVHKHLENANMASAMHDYAPPDMRAVLRATCDALVRTRWGRATTEEQRA